MLFLSDIVVIMLHNYDRPGSVVQPYLTDKLNDGDKLFSKDYPIVFPRPYPGFELAAQFGEKFIVESSECQVAS